MNKQGTTATSSQLQCIHAVTDYNWKTLLVHLNLCFSGLYDSYFCVSFLFLLTWYFYNGIEIFSNNILFILILCFYVLMPFLSAEYKHFPWSNDHIKT